MLEKVFFTNKTTMMDFIESNYPGFKIVFGKFPMDCDISHGVEIEKHDNSKFGYGITVSLYPFVLWTDGGYHPVHYWGDRYYITLEKR